MKRSRYETVGNVALKMLREEGLETPLNEYRLLSAWGEVMGEAVAHYTGKMFIKNDVLYVQIKSPALKANLLMGRDSIKARLNAHVRANVIQRVVFT